MNDQPVAWGMPRPDGAIIDCITPEEHAREPGQYTVPLCKCQPRLDTTAIRAQALEDAAGVCEEVHDRYPTDIFPDGQSVDAQSAKMARITANNIAAAIRALAKEKT
jgi:hypothetical protein